MCQNLLSSFFSTFVALSLARARAAEVGMGVADCSPGAGGSWRASGERVASFLPFLYLLHG